MAIRLSPVQRRIVYALSFEGIGLVISALVLLAFSGSETVEAAGAATGSMLLALGWNYVFNWGFERWEHGRKVRGRPLARRLAHGALFEGGLLLLSVPFLAWWLGVTLFQALMYDIGLLIFFAVYTVLFTWGFDRLFGLPDSAR